MVCNGGASTLLGAQRVSPLLLLPIGAAHFANTRAAVRRGVAGALESDADAGAIHAGIARITSDPVLRTSAAAVSEEIAAMTTAAAAGDAILDWLGDESSAA